MGLVDLYTERNFLYYINLQYKGEQFTENLSKRGTLVMRADDNKEIVRNEIRKDIAEHIILYCYE